MSVNVCPDIFCVSDQICSVSPEPLNLFFFFTKLCIVVYYHESICHEENLIHSLQCQGNSEGLHNQDVTIFTISSKLLVC